MIKHKKPGKHFIRGQLGFHKKFVMPGKADVLPVTVTGSYAKLGHFWLRQFPHSGYVPVIAEAKPAYHPHSGYVPVTAEAEQAYQVERDPLCGASPNCSKKIVRKYHR